MRWNIAGITIIDVGRDKGYELTPEITWAVGMMVVTAFKKRYGALPPKDLRYKTYDNGVHCFAIYPETMRVTIELAYEAYFAEKARQLEMFPITNPSQGEMFTPTELRP